MKNKLSKRLWLSFILIGLAGQLAWSIENMYLNVFSAESASRAIHCLAAALSAAARPLSTKRDRRFEKRGAAQVRAAAVTDAATEAFLNPWH